MDLKTFLLARIEEDEADARDAYYEGQTWAPEEEAVVDLSRDWDTVMHMPRKRDAVHASNWSPDRVLAECAAKREIIEFADRVETMDYQITNEWGGDLDGTGDDILKALAAVYADHPDYQPEWKLSL